MAKDPAFLFYPKDFSDGTQDFTDEEVGSYLRLLIFQFSQGRLSEDRIKRKMGSSFSSIWPVISCKFRQDKKGLFYNERLEEEQGKRSKFTESRRNNRKGKKDMKNISKTYDEHMVNANANVISNLNTSIGDSVKGDSDPIQDFKNSQMWKEDFCMKKKCSMLDLELAMQYFIDDKTLTVELNKSLDEIKKHFVGWWNRTGSQMFNKKKPFKQQPYPEHEGF